MSLRALYENGDFAGLIASGQNEPLVATAFFVTGHVERAAEMADRALGDGSLSERDSSAWRLVHCDVAFAHGRSEAGLAAARQAVAGAAMGSGTAVRAKMAWARAYGECGDLASKVALYRAAVDDAERGSDPFVRGEAHMALASALGSEDRAAATMHLAAAKAAWSGRPYWLARADLPTPLVEVLNAEEAKRVFERSLVVFQRHADALSMAIVHVGLARQCRDMGLLDEAFFHSSETMRLGYARHQSLGLYGLSEVARLRGDRVQADTLLQLALTEPGTSVGQLRQLCLPSLEAAARRGDEVGVDQCTRWAAEYSSAMGADLWQALDVCQATSMLPYQRIRLAALAWDGSSEVIREQRAAQLKELGRLGIPCGPLLAHHPIGEGGMATVWAATHPERPGERLAIKFITRPSLRGISTHDLFEREVRAVTGLHQHPHVEPVLERGRATAAAEALSEGAILADSPWIAMPMADGGSLSRWCGRMAWTDVRSVLDQVLSALAHAHAYQVLHLDVKPDNVLLHTTEPPFVARLTDFGLARATFEARDALGAGTPQFMAPEQFSRDWRRWSPTTDLYAVGCMALQLVTGQPPFVGTVAELRDAHCSGPLPGVPASAAVPEGFEAWVHRLLAKAPQERTPSAAVARAELAALGTAAAGESGWNESEAGSSLITLDLDSSSAALPAPDSGRAHRFLSMPTTWEEWMDARPASSASLATVRHPPVIGRQAQQQTLWSAARRAFAKRAAQVVIFDSPARGGGSELLLWMGYQARLSGFARVLSARFRDPPSPSDGLEGMVRVAMRSQSLSGSQLTAWLECCPWRPPGMSVQTALEAHRPHQDPSVVVPWVDATAQVPTVLLFHDVEHSGGLLSLLPALHALRRPLLIAMTGDLGRSSGLLKELLSIAVAQGAGAYTVPPLSDREAVTLADAILPVHLPHREALLKGCGGHPGRILGALRVLSDKAVQREDGRYEVPLGHFEHQAFEGTAVPVPASGLMTALGLALLGGKASRELVAAVVEGAGHACDIQSLLDAKLCRVDEGRFVLPGHLRGGLQQMATALGVDRALHRSAAKALRGSVDPWLSVREGRHWMAAGDHDFAAAAFLRASEGLASPIKEAVLAERRRALTAGLVPPDDPRWSQPA